MAKVRGAPEWRKERKRRQKRKDRVFKQEAKVPHMQIRYKIDADGNPTGKPIQDPPKPSTRGPRPCDLKPIYNVLSTLETIRRPNGQILTLCVMECLGTPYVRLAVEHPSFKNGIRYVTINLDEVEKIGNALLDLDYDAVRSHIVGMRRLTFGEVSNSVPPPSTMGPVLLAPWEDPDVEGS